MSQRHWAVEKVTNTIDSWSEDEKRSIFGFLGYGRPSASIWFIGHEEGLGGKTSPDEEVQNLHARGKWAKVMDMHKASLTLTEKGKPIDMSKPRSGSTAVWQNVSRILRASQGAPDWADGGLARRYMRERLGRLDGDAFLTELRGRVVEGCGASL